MCNESVTEAVIQPSFRQYHMLETQLNSSQHRVSTVTAHQFNVTLCGTDAVWFGIWAS